MPALAPPRGGRAALEVEKDHRLRSKAITRWQLDGTGTIVGPGSVAEHE
jgi:hypothetical protein